MDLTTGDMTVLDIEKIDIRAAGNSTLVVSLDSVKASALTSNALRILADAGDTVIVGAGWRADLPTFINNRLTHIITEAGTDGSVRIELQNGRFFQNPLNRFDVDRNGRIEPLDALQVLNSIRRLGTGQLALPTNDNGMAVVRLQQGGPKAINAARNDRHRDHRLRHNRESGDVRRHSCFILPFCIVDGMRWCTAFRRSLNIR